MEKSFWHEYFSIPNIMGYFRIILAALYLVLFYNSMHGGTYWFVIGIIVLSGLTDFFDGKIARKFDMITDWGKMLDPIADKITIGVIIVSLALKYRIVIVMILLYILKEGYMAVAGLFLMNRGHKIEGAMWYGKFCTFGTYIILIVLLLFPDMPKTFVDVLVIINMGIMVFTLGNYMMYYGKILNKKEA